MPERLPWKLLLVEDDQEDYLLTRDMLLAAGGGMYQIEWACTYKAGLQSLQAYPYDAVLVDYDLGEHSGLDLIQEAVGHCYPAPIILFSGRNSDEIDNEAMQAGAAFYLPKGEATPFILEQIIRQAIGRKQSEQSLAEANARLSQQKQDLEEKNSQLQAELAEGQRNDLSRLYRTLLALGKSSQAMMHAANETAYLKEVCKIIAEDCGHAMVWIGFCEQDEARSVRPVASAGFEAGYLETLHITWADTELGQGPTGIAIRSGKPAMCRNMLTDPRFKPWRDEALKRGYAASIALPLIANEVAFGSLAIYSREPDSFSEEEVRLLTELANDLAYGIITLRLREANTRVEIALQTAYESLRQSEERYRSLFTGMTEGFALHEIICDEGGAPWDYRFLDVNPAFERLTGLKREDVVGKFKSEIPQLSDDDPRWVEIYGKVALTGEPVRFENYSPPLQRHYDVYSYCPAPGQFAVIFVDITNHKAMEESLRINLAKYSVLFDSFPIGVSISDPEGHILEANAEAEHLLGISREEHLLRQIDGAEWQIIRPDGTPMPPEEYASVRALKENRGIGRVEMGIQKPGQPVIWISVSATPIPIEGYGVIIVYWDITDRKNAEKTLRENTAHLEQLNRELQDFAFIASHDLKEPLRKIRSFGDRVIATASAELNAEQRDYLRRMVSAATRMQSMVDGLLAYSRVTTHAQPHSQVNLSQVTTEVLTDLEFQVEQSQAQIDVTSLPIIEADPLQMRQLLQNLIGNALKFTRHGVTHRVKVFGKIDQGPGLSKAVAKIYVEDNGIGFDMKDLPKLFQPFHRLVGRSDFEGSGIGLAVCRKIVERHEGSITAESESGKGSTFIVTLPVKQV